MTDVLCCASWPDASLPPGLPAPYTVLGGITVNLLAPDLKCEIVLTIDHEGESRIFYSKPSSRNDLGLIAAKLVDAGMMLAAEHGITLTLGGPGGQRIEFPPPQAPGPRAVAPPPPPSQSNENNS